MKSYKTVKWIFVFFLFYLPFQYMLVGVVGVMYSEPWPAFVLPGFKNVYATQDHVEITEPKFFAQPADSNESQAKIDTSKLFKGLPTSQLQGFIRSNFNENRDLSTEAKNWLQNQLERIYPQKKFTALQVVWTPVLYFQEGDSVRVVTKENGQTITIPLDN